MNKAVITIQGSIIKIPCYNQDQIDYYTNKLKCQTKVFTIHLFETSQEVLDFMERGC